MNQSANAYANAILGVAALALAGFTLYADHIANAWAGVPFLLALFCWAGAQPKTNRSHKD